MSTREYLSVIFTVDHTTDIPVHSVQKMVFSTQTLEEAAVAVMAYYDESHLLTSTDTIRQFQEIGKATLPGLIYRTPENVQIIMSLDTFAALCDRSETLLEATAFVLDTAGELINMAEQASGSVVPLIALSWSEEEAAPAPCATTEG